MNNKDLRSRIRSKTPEELKFYRDRLKATNDFIEIFEPVIKEELYDKVYDDFEVLRWGWR